MVSVRRRGCGGHLLLPLGRRPRRIVKTLIIHPLPPPLTPEEKAQLLALIKRAGLDGNEWTPPAPPPRMQRALFKEDD